MIYTKETLLRHLAFLIEVEEEQNRLDLERNNRLDEMMGN